MKKNKILVLAILMPLFFSACENTPEREMSSEPEPQVEARSDEVETEEIHVHEMGDWEEIAATYWEPGVRVRKCLLCDYEESEEIPVLEKPKLQELGSFKECDGKITFGVWPQSIKDEEVTIDETCINTEIEGNEFFFGDDGNWYARCQENALETGAEEGIYQRYYYSNGMPACQKDSERILYFKVEPIEWCRLGTSDVLITEKAIMGNVPFYDGGNAPREKDGNPVYSCDYSESKLRAFLNGNSFKNENDEDCGFFEQSFFCRAFTKEMQVEILESLVKNDGDSTVDFSGTQEKAIGTGDYINAVCPDTLDKVFALSLQELTDPEYGFLNMSASDSNRVKTATDYAIANYAALGDKGVTWFTRSPYWKQKASASNKIVYTVNATGKILISKKVTDASICVVPAIRMKNK